MTELNPNAPKWMMLAPLVIGGGYLAYSYGYKKKSLAGSMLIAGILATGALLPWFSYSGQNGNGIALSAPVADNTEALINSDINEMNKTGRQEAVDYIISKMRTDKRESLRPSLDTLTNDELKALYVAYRLREDESKVSTEDDTQVKREAKEKYGIDLTGNNIYNTIRIAMTKVINPIKTIT